MFRLIIQEDAATVFCDKFEGSVVVGRADVGEPAPFARLRRDADTWKVVMAATQDTDWSRQQIIFEPSGDGAKVKVTNGGSGRRLQIEDGPVVLPGKSHEVVLPAVINLGGAMAVHLQAVGGTVGGLPNATLPPTTGGATARLPTLAALPLGINQKEVIAWMNAATDVLQAAVGSDEFFDRAVTAAVQMVGLNSARLLLYRGGDWHPQAVAPAPPRVAQPLRPSERVLNQVLKEKRTVWAVFEGDRDGHDSLLGVGAVIAAPVLDREGRVIGALYGERRRAASATAPPISEAEAMLVELLARGVAAGLARQEQERAAVALQHEMAIGRKIQEGFLPKSLTQPAGWEIGTAFEPAREVSGDFYDVFTLSETHVGLVIADVCDKGVGPALFMALFRSLIRAFSHQGIARDLTGSLVSPPRPAGPPGDRHLGTLLIELNALTTIALTSNYVAELHRDSFMFATIFYGVLDTTAGSLHYVNAGHDPPIHLGPDGVKGRLQPTGKAAGLEPGQHFAIRTVTLEPGDLLLCYTDGVTEARSPTGAFFTEKRLLELVSRPYTSAAQVLDRVEASVNAHTGGAPPSDDLTLLAVYRSPTTAVS
jgi:sigma-B regulation protein RsbU (phosphoserine phosphatase)